MTTSNSTVWELTRDDIIAAALRKIGVLNKGDSPDSDDLNYGQVALNGIIARFNTLGMPLWKRTETEVTIVDGQIDYLINPAIKVTEVYLKSLTSATIYKLEQRSRYDQLAMPHDTDGIPVSYNVTTNLAEGSTVTIWPWPTASEASNYSLVVVSQDEFDTFTSAGETPDFPAYWSDALIYALAVSLAPEKGIPLNDRKILQQEAALYLAQAQSYGDEDGSLFIQPYHFPR